MGAAIQTGSDVAGLFTGLAVAIVGIGLVEAAGTYGWLDRY